MEEEFQGLRSEMQQGFGEVHHQIDDTQKNIKRLDNNIEELRGDVQNISKRILEDTNANAKDILSLKNRFRKLYTKNVKQ